MLTRVASAPAPYFAPCAAMSSRYAFAAFFSPFTPLRCDSVRARLYSTSIGSTSAATAATAPAATAPAAAAPAAASAGFGSGSGSGEPDDAAASFIFSSGGMPNAALCGGAIAAVASCLKNWSFAGAHSCDCLLRRPACFAPGACFLLLRPL